VSLLLLRNDLKPARSSADNSCGCSQNAQFGWSLTGGAAIDNAGNVYFAWEGYTQNGGAKGPVNIYVSKSSDKRLDWTASLVDFSSAPPNCSAHSCGGAFLGPGTALTADSGGRLYLLWNAGAVDFGTERIYFSSSLDGIDWSQKVDISAAPTGVDHAFPAIVAGSADISASPGWTNVIARAGMFITEHLLTEVRAGLQRADCRTTFRGTAISLATVSVFRSVIISISRSII
jgi:hypothetical protein